LAVTKELRAMVNGFIDGIKTLFWSLILLFTAVYTVALVMRETVGESELRDDPKNDHFIQPFTTLTSSFFTCFRCLMGDCSSDSGQPLPVLITQQFGWPFAVGYIVVLSGTTIGLFNVIIAVYVDNVQEAAKANASKALNRRLSDQDKYNAIVVKLTRVAVQQVMVAKRASRASVGQTLEHSNTLMQAERDTLLASLDKVEMTREVFETFVKTPEVQDMLDEMDLYQENRMSLFDVLDSDGGGSLSLPEILNGFTMLRGDPRRTDVVSVWLMLRAVQEHQKMEGAQLKELQEESASVLQNIHRSMTVESISKN